MTAFTTHADISHHTMVRMCGVCRQAEDGINANLSHAVSHVQVSWVGMFLPFFFGWYFKG